MKRTVCRITSAKVADMTSLQRCFREQHLAMSDTRLHGGSGIRLWHTDVPTPSHLQQRMADKSLFLQEPAQGAEWDSIGEPNTQLLL